MASGERQAIERLRAGDVAGLEYLVHEYSARAVQTAYLVTHDVPTAEDVAQEAFLRAYQRIGQFEVGRPFGPWFLTSVLRDSIKAARKRSRHRSLADFGGDGSSAPADWLRDGRPGPEELWEQAETAEELETTRRNRPRRPRRDRVWDHKAQPDSHSHHRPAAPRTARRVPHVDQTTRVASHTSDASSIRRQISPTATSTASRVGRDSSSDISNEYAGRETR